MSFAMSWRAHATRAVLSTVLVAPVLTTSIASPLPIHLDPVPTPAPAHSYPHPHPHAHPHPHTHDTSHHTNDGSLIGETAPSSTPISMTMTSIPASSSSSSSSDPDHLFTSSTTPSTLSPSHHISSSQSHSQSSPSHPQHLHLMADSGQLSHTHRMMSAAVGSLITSLVVTPLDVIKTRLQAQMPGKASNPSASAAAAAASSSRNICHHAPYHTMMDVWYETCYSQTHLQPWTPWQTQPSRVQPLILCHECHVDTPTTTATRPSTTHHPNGTLRFNSSTDAMLKLIRYEGVTSLWRGLSPTLIMSIPSTVIYFSVYDWLKDCLLRWHYGTKTMYDDRFASYVPMVAGISARSMTTTIVAPIELIRTKAQAHDKHVSMITLMRSELSKSRSYANLWRGVSPTLLRDVPFSGIYWSSYEWSKAYLMERYYHTHDKQTLVWSSFLSGAFGGMLSATITHPFDLVKTRRQIELYAASGDRVHIPESTSHIIRTIIHEEGWLGLTNGLAARLVKVTPACAIMISSYEIAKTYFRIPTTT